MRPGVLSRAAGASLRPALRRGEGGGGGGRQPGGGAPPAHLGPPTGFPASFPVSALRKLRAEWSVVSITRDMKLEPHGNGGRGKGGGGSNEPADMGSMYATTLLT